MNKLELIDELHRQTGLIQPIVKNAVEIFFEEIANTLAKDGRVEIRGLCSFFVKKYKGYTGRNPKTAKTQTVHPKKLPYFKCGKELRDRVNKNFK